jgi:hypothetical protein
MTPAKKWTATRSIFFGVQERVGPIPPIGIPGPETGLWFFGYPSSA